MTTISDIKVDAESGRHAGLPARINRILVPADLTNESQSAIDFGLWGMILYPIILSALFRLVAELVKMHLPDVVATLVILFLLYNALVTEGGLWIRLLAIRDCLLYSALLWVLFKIPAFSLKQQPERGALSQ